MEARSKARRCGCAVTSPMYFVLLPLCLNVDAEWFREEILDRVRNRYYVIGVAAPLGACLFGLSLCLLASYLPLHWLVPRRRVGHDDLEAGSIGSSQGWLHELRDDIGDSVWRRAQPMTAGTWIMSFWYRAQGLRSGRWPCVRNSFERISEPQNLELGNNVHLGDWFLLQPNAGLCISTGYVVGLGAVVLGSDSVDSQVPPLTLIGGNSYYDTNVKESRKLVLNTESVGVDSPHVCVVGYRRSSRGKARLNASRSTSVESSPAWRRAFGRQRPRS